MTQYQQPLNPDENKRTEIVETVAGLMVITGAATLVFAISRLARNYQKNLVKQAMKEVLREGHIQVRIADFLEYDIAKK